MGQTAPMVKSVFQRAKGGVLFIDEAYSLLDKGSGRFGDEALNTIVQEMENNRKDTVVIFAGYPDEMDEFFLRNPGLRSRVPFRVRFDDYTVDELTDICELEAGKRGFLTDKNAKEIIKKLCESSTGNVENGNGRFCRNLVEKAVLNFALRNYSGDEVADNIEYILKKEDFNDITVFNRKKTAIGF